MGVIVRPELNNGWKPVFGSGYRLNPDHPLNKSLIAWWIFNEGGGKYVKNLASPRSPLNDFTGSYLDPYGLVNNNAQWVTTNSPGIPAIGTGNYCVHAKVMFTYPATNMGIVAFGSYDPTWAKSSSDSLYIYDGGAKTTGSAVLTINVPGTLTWSREGTGTNQTKQYVNGIATTPCTHGDSIGAPTTISIGADRDGIAAYSFRGVIYEVAIWNRSLSPAEVAALNSAPYGTPSNPRLLFPSGRVYFVPSGAGGEPSGFKPYWSLNRHRTIGVGVI